MTSTAQQGWAATSEVRDNHPVILVAHNGEPAGMITLPEDATPEDIARIKDTIFLNFNDPNVDF